MRDMFSRGSDNVSQIGLYMASIKKAGGKVSDRILDMINFEYRDCKTQTADSFTFGGVEYLKENNPSVNINRCSEIRAVNNEIVFQTGNYYKFSDASGKPHVLTCAYGRLKQPYSDVSRGIVDDTSYDVGKFWNLLATNGTYMGLYYTADMERKLLNDAGITEGFFSVQVGDNKQEYYYSNGNAGIAVPKWRYDKAYELFMTYNEAALMDYEPGDVFKIAGKEYVLSADKKLDIPYEVDLFDMKYPKKTA